MDPMGSFFNQLHCALSFQVYSYVIRLEKKIKLIISSDGIKSDLEHLEILLKAFGVHRRGEQRPVFTLEEGILRLRQVNSYFVQRKDAVRAFTGQTKELQGPDGLCSPQTYREVSP